MLIDSCKIDKFWFNDSKTAGKANFKKMKTIYFIIKNEVK